MADLGMAAMPHREIWQHARDLGACIVTKDEDFVLLAGTGPRRTCDRVDTHRQRGAKGPFAAATGIMACGNVRD